MQRIPALDPETTEGKSKELFDFVTKKLGMVPNMMRVMGNSPAVLNGYLSFVQALDQGSIGAKMAEQIALTVACKNNAAYCSTAHTFISAKILKLDSNTIILARSGKSSRKKTQAALTFVVQLIEKKGNVSNQDVEELKREGFSDSEITEIIAHTALNILTNFITNASDVTIDFPSISLI
jgi:uncharacterized peroxidase-related enzyme